MDKGGTGTYDPTGLFLRLRKNLRALVVVHATWYVKAFLALVRPFIRYEFKAQGHPFNCFHY